LRAEAAEGTLMPPSEPTLTSGQVARLFGVKPRAVRAWADARKLTSTRTLGGHRRYREAEVLALHASLRTEAVA
jgi:excisionase family DNA binding protein